MKRLPARSLAVLLTFAWLGTGCAQQSQPSSFYVLSYEESDAQSDPVTTMRDGLSLGIGPVELPQYLDRPQIVTRASENQLTLEEFDRWGGRLKENFTAVLAEVLSDELSTDRIQAHPWNTPSRVQYQIVVQVTNFDTSQDGRSILHARWSIVDVGQQRVLATARSTLLQEIAAADPATQSMDYDAITAAMSRNVAELGREIAKQIRLLSGA